MAIGLGANVTLLDINPDRLRQLDDQFHGRLNTLMSNSYNLAEVVRKADLLIGAVLIPGARAPRLVTEEMVKMMEKGSVIVDVAIDQGGSIETIESVTTHNNPTYLRHGVLHYAVANMPGAVARTSTYALSNVTIPYGLYIASKGYKKAALENKALARGFNTIDGCVTYKAVAEAVGYEYFITHHYDKYGGKFPVWVATEVTSIGVLSKLYSNMKIDDKKEITKKTMESC